MVQIPIEVERFLARVRRTFPSCKIYLFGSRARGTPHRDSDWDFVVVGSEFKRWDKFHRIVEVYRLDDGEAPIDVICFTPEEFEQEKRGPSIIQEAIREGELVEVEA